MKVHLAKKNWLLKKKKKSIALALKECWYEWSVPGAQELGQSAFKSRSDP